MLKPERMKRLVITGPKSTQTKVIKLLYKQKVLHIVDHKKDEFFDIGNPLETTNALSEVVVKLRSIAHQLKIDMNENPDIKAFSSFIHEKGLAGYEKIGAASRKLLEEINSLSSIKEQLEKEKEDLEQKNHAIDIRLALGLPKEAFEDLKSISLIIGSITKFPDEADLKKISSRYELWSAQVEAQRFVALAVESDKKKHFTDFLNQYSFQEINLNLDSSKDYDHIAKENLRRLKEINDELSKIESELETLKNKWSNFLRVGINILSQQIEKGEAPLRMASTSNTYIVNGWVGESDYEEVTSELLKATENKIHIIGETPTQRDDPPVKLKHNRVVRPFQFLLDLYTLPRYSEYDPSVLMFLTFPIFYGFMLGDMGYGLTLLITFLILKRVIPAGKALFNILIFSSISTIVFGFLMGEFFGSEEVFGVKLFTVFSREAIIAGHSVGTLIPSTVNAFLVISVILGILHINMGLITGFFNVMKNHGFMHAVYEKFSWILLQISAGVIGAAYAAPQVLAAVGLVGPVGKYVGFGLLALTAYMLFKGEGVKGLIEMPAIFSNIFSYARLMALGLASVSLAVVINEFVRDFWGQGGAMIAVAILVFVIGHTINIALGVLGPFLHSLRLTYVEFFSKFYEGGGKKFTPFGSKNMIKT